jgi:hypothetical protein
MEPINAVRDLLTRYAIGTVASLHMPDSDSDPNFWDRISHHPKVPTQFIRDNMDKPWNFGILSANPNVTLELIAEFPDAGWNFYYLSGNPNLTWDYIMLYSACGWDMRTLSKNPVITVEIVKNNPLWGWDMLSFVINPNVTMDVIKNTMRLDDTFIYYTFIYNNPNATWEHIKDYPCIKYETWINTHKCVTPYIVRTNPQYRWMPDMLARNPNFDIATLTKMFPRSAYWLLKSYESNPNISVGDILEHGRTAEWVLDDASSRVHWREMCKSMSKIKWSWTLALLSRNPTIFDCSVEIEQAKRVKAALVILKWWRESMSNPEYKLCKQRLAREFADM